AHPYEEPAFDVFELAPLPGGRGFGRVGRLAQPVTVGRLLAMAADVLPATPSGVRATGAPDRMVSTLAVSGGAGDAFLTDAAAAGADAFLTADLRHHPAAEHIEADGPALVCATHWATEQPWLHDAAQLLRARLGDTVETVVSELVTDAWSMHLPSTKESSSAP
ncbi:MAG: Nif3-like dinuclear metal center hexameric protein, partial [Mycobacteriales bacterium]